MKASTGLHVGKKVALSRPRRQRCEEDPSPRPSLDHIKDLSQPLTRRLAGRPAATAASEKMPRHYLLPGHPVYEAALKLMASLMKWSAIKTPQSGAFTFRSWGASGPGAFGDLVSQQGQTGVGLLLAPVCWFEDDVLVLSRNVGCGVHMR